MSLQYVKCHVRQTFTMVLVCLAPFAGVFRFLSHAVSRATNCYQIIVWTTGKINNACTHAFCQTMVLVQ